MKISSKKVFKFGFLRYTAIAMVFAVAILIVISKFNVSSEKVSIVSKFKIIKSTPFSEVITFESVKLTIPNKVITPEIVKLTPQEKKAGKKPKIIIGEVVAITKYLNNNLKDPNSLKVIQHSEVKLEELNGSAYWYQHIKYKSKNSSGEYVIKDQVFKIRDNKVFDVVDAHTFVKKS